MQPAPETRPAERAMGRKEREDQERRNHILETAERLLGDKSIQNTSVAEIAREAEFGVGTLYRYFQDKTALIDALLELRLHEHFDVLESALAADGSPAERVERFAAAYFRSLQERRAFFRFYYWHFHPGKGLDEDTFASGPFLNRRLRKVFATLEKVFEAGINAGQFANAAPSSLLAAATWGMMMSFYFLNEEQVMPEHDESALSAFLVRILFSDIRRTTLEQGELRHV